MNTTRSRWIIVCATQRTGSTLVCEDLRNNGLGNAEEHFLPFVADHSSPPENILSAVARAFCDAGGICSVKIMASYATLLDSRLRTTELRAPDEPALRALATMYDNVVWVYVTRRSQVRQAISRVLSRKRGINHLIAREEMGLRPGKSVVAGPDIQLGNVSATADELADNCLDILREVELWERFFATNAISPIRVVYEDIAASTEYIKLVGNSVDKTISEVNSNRLLLRMSDQTNEALLTEFIDGTKAATDGWPCEVSSQKVLEAARARWVDTPYYDAAEGLARTQWDTVIGPFLKDQDIDFDHTLELAVGHGRMSQILLETSHRYIGLDVLKENIDYCRDRFKNSTHGEFHVSDGLRLTVANGNSVSFGFCYDSMVHFDPDVVRAYLFDFARVLRPGGLAFFHHSNYGANPTGDFRRSPHARNFMTQNMFKFLVMKAGLYTVKSLVIDWGSGQNRFKDHDCLSLVRRP
jgi:LPS sulfotransferase NodH/SAM-dependent methyltransferase